MSEHSPTSPPPPAAPGPEPGRQPTRNDQPQKRYPQTAANRATTPLDPETFAAQLRAHHAFLSAGGGGAGHWETFIRGSVGVVWAEYRGQPPGLPGQPLSLHLQRLDGLPLRGARLQCANLVGVSACAQDLSGADLSGCIATDSDFTGASFQGANLRGADLSRCELRACDFRQADLTGADLTEADLTGADLTGARLDGLLVANTRFDAIRISEAAIQRRADSLIRTRHSSSLFGDI